jgi:hypothetical protein
MKSPTVLLPHRAVAVKLVGFALREACMRQKDQRAILAILAILAWDCLINYSMYRRAPRNCRK